MEDRLPYIRSGALARPFARRYDPPVGAYVTAEAAIDRALAEDPKGRELDYGARMTSWARRLKPDASEELLLAVRAQHVRRGSIPRSDFPAGRAGYLAWREKLKRVHADVLGAAMKDAGYGEASIAKARSLILRKEKAADPEGQVLEDAACLVFLETELSDFAAKTEEEKMIDILRKTWQKMSPAGREAALSLKVGEREAALLRRALT
jgi:hypothetical protein